MAACELEKLLLLHELMVKHDGQLAYKQAEIRLSTVTNTAV